MRKDLKVWIFTVLVLVSLVAGGSYIYSRRANDSIDNNNSEKKDVNSNTLKVQSLFLEFPRIGVENVGLKVNPAVKYIDSVKKGEKLEETISFEYSGNLEKANIQLEISDFDINRVDCTQRQPIVDKSSANSAVKYVSISKKSYNTAVLNIELPKDIEDKTYWFGVKTSQKVSETLTTSLYSAYFVTVGDQRSEPCLIK